MSVKTHKEELASGERFAFGDNWRQFIAEGTTGTVIAATVKRFVQEEQERRKNEITASAASEVVKRLDVIEGYIRMLEVETDSLRRTVTFQVALQETSEIAAKKTSGEIPAHVLQSAEVQAQAKSTSDHLVRLGLADDPLNVEIIRLFSLVT